jgi:hypothetical protein
MIALPPLLVWPMTVLLHAAPHIAPDGTIHNDSDGLAGTLYMVGYFLLSVLLFALTLRSPKVGAYQVEAPEPESTTSDLTGLHVPNAPSSAPSTTPHA